MKRETLTLAKFKRMRRRGDLRTTEAAGILTVLWSFTARNCPEGFIDLEHTEDLAEEMGYSIDEIDPVLNLLAETKWLDKTPEGFMVHDWASHCEDSVHFRLIQERRRFADGSIPKLTKLSQKERPEVLKDYQQTARGNPAQRCAVRGNPAPTDTDTDTEPSLTDTESSARRFTNSGSDRPEPSKASDIVDSLKPPRGSVTVERILTITQESPEYGAWWRAVAERLKSVGEEGALRDALAHVEGAKGIQKPGAFLNARCRDALKRHGRCMPKKPQKELVND